MPVKKAVIRGGSRGRHIRHVWTFYAYPFVRYYPFIRFFQSPLLVYTRAVVRNESSFWSHGQVHALDFDHKGHGFVPGLGLEGQALDRWPSFPVATPPFPRLPPPLVSLPFSSSLVFPLSFFPPHLFPFSFPDQVIITRCRFWNGESCDDSMF